MIFVLFVIFFVPFVILSEVAGDAGADGDGAQPEQHAFDQGKSRSD